MGQISKRGDRKYIDNSQFLARIYGFNAEASSTEGVKPRATVRKENGYEKDY